MTPRDDTDDPLADLLASAGGGAPPPDPDFLARLRATSTDAFLAAGQPPASPAPPRRSSMSALLARLSAAAVAAAILIAASVFFLSGRSGPPPLAQVLDRVADADALHLRVTKGDQTAEVFVAPSNKLRWEESADRYLIAQGQNVYRVDEKANRVTPGVADYFRPDRPGLDVFGLLGLPRPNPEALRDARPAAAEKDGVAVNVYRLALADHDGTPLTVEAEADAATGQLLAVQAFAHRGNAAQLVASLLVVAQGQPVPPEKFAISNTLAEDGRVGKVVDVQGVVSVKPVNHSRWTPVRPNVLLMPGDWVRADVRGANAATLRLLPQAAVIVGPGGLVEVVKPTQLRLHEGEAEINPAKNTPIELLGPDGRKEVVKERAFFRVQNEQIVKAPKEPLWLKGFKGATANESIGSLVAKVDGRNVALSVGSHKVTVDVRDQIARTTIEETFVNHTDAQLEGQFHFPLPPDASISGFAMWIGDQMVEADVVEKQRAREIYEEIMREKRDPGLLEWTGGNVFKARVWPIFAHSEKRIRITYTQVLPLKGNKYRYSYALQSEMLQQHPLKDLSIDVKVNSAVPLKSVTSPTHACRADQTEHSAHLEFAAQEYTPTRDFEAVVEVAEQAPVVAVVPHRRGSDGYFLCTVTPPAGPAPDRDLVADAGPLDLRVVCDTSASMDPVQRGKQNGVAAALLDALTPKDTFNLATCDVNADWAFDKPQPATPENVQKARTILAGRVSLGWTDLDRAFDSALKQCGPRTQVVYLGDGIVTAGDANPQAFADRLRTMYKASGATATLHAVALGSAFEPAVMKAIGGLGGGSFRRVTSEQPPVAVALELLGEMTRPPVRDLKVEFPGWKTAMVYPEVLPNLVPGTQQILIGRYLPEGKDQTGEVVVSGQQDGKEVRYTARATLADAEQGNSFLPRLWARMHLDKLLEQPQTDAVRDDVIALSEEFGIITPYTSLLVLESDADRERFKVKRRFQMRNGEKFFAQGRDQAQFELARQQMKRAGDWRLGLRRNVLGMFSLLGRDPRMFDNSRPQPFGGIGGGTEFDGRGGYYLDGFQAAGWAERTGMVALTAGVNSDAGLNGSLILRDLDAKDSPWALGMPAEPTTPLAAGTAGEEVGRLIDTEEKAKDKYYEDLAEGGELSKARKEWFAGEDFPADMKKLSDLTYEAYGRRAGGLGGLRGYGVAGLVFSVDGPSGGPAAAGKLYFYTSRGPTRRAPDQTRWFDPLFPSLPAPAAATAPPKSDWPQEARDLARSLLRRDALAKLAGGVVIDRRADSFDPRDGTLTAAEHRLELYSPAAWVARTESDASQTLTEWCEGKERGALGTAFRLGRVRASTPADLRDPPLNLGDYSLDPLDRAYAHMTAAVEKAGGKPVLVLRQADRETEWRFTIDPEKRAVTKLEQIRHGKPESTTTYSDFAEVGGSWWARAVETADGQGRRTARVAQTVAALDAGPFADRVKQLLAGRDGTLLLKSPAPSAADARKAVAAGKARLDDHFALVNHYAAFQQWAKAGEHLDAVEKLSAGKPGTKWLRTVFLQASRRGEELRQQLLAEAGDVVKMPAGGDRVALADFVYGQAQSVLAANELLELSDKLGPVYADLPKYVPARRQWRQNRANALRNAGRGEDALATEKQIAEEYPRDLSAQSQYVQSLFNRGDHEAAFASLRKQLAPGTEWSGWEEESLRSTYAGWLEQLGREQELVEFLADWVKRGPESETAYARYLSALVHAGEQKKADELIAKWLKEAQVRSEIASPVRARFQAAERAAAGHGYNLNTDRPDPKWFKPLADAARFFIDHPEHYPLASVVLDSWQFQQADEGRRLRGELFDRLSRGVADLPTPRLNHLIGVVLSNPPDGDKVAWAKLADALRGRWAKEADPNLKHQLGGSVARLLSERVGSDEHLDFLRVQLKDGPENYRTEYTARLFDGLLQAAWSEPREAEALALLPKLGSAEQPDARLFAQVAALHRLTDHAVQARYGELRKGLKEPEKLTRTELAKKQTELMNQARTAYAERLAKLNLPDGLRPWAAAERVYLLAKADADPKPLAAEVWAFLGDAPKARPEDEEPTPRRELDDLLHDRYLAMAFYFATRKGAAAELNERALKYLDAGIAAEPAEPGWKAAKFQLLVALDRPKDLEAALSKWVKAGDVDGRWRTALGFLLAELGRLDEAIKLAEEVEKSGDLGYAGYQALAGWYMAVNKKGAHEKALVNSYKTVDEYRLQQVLQVKLGPWYRGGGHVPTELDPDVLRVFAALFEKSSAPQNYLYLLQQFYQACHDFRLLAAMTDAVIGQSAGKIYPFLEGMQGVLNELRDEAAADELLARIDTLRKSTQTPTDLRALDLLEMQVRRRAAEVLNQPGPHAARALEAMRRAYARPWADGERMMMSNLLRGLGHISRKELADEQLRELRELHAVAGRNTSERLFMAHNLGTVLGYQGRHKEGVEVLQSALDEYVKARGGFVQPETNGPVATLVPFHEALREYPKAEELLQRLAKKPGNDEQARWLSMQLNELYHRALQNDQAVSLGSGAKLYRALADRVVEEAKEAEPNHRYELINLLCRVYHTARGKNVPTVDADLKEFAHKTLPPMLKGQSNYYESIVSQVANTLRQLVDAAEAVAFLVNRIEQEPAWFKLNNQDGWQRHGWMLAQWRSEAKALPADLERRLLKIVLTELRADLRAQRARNRVLYWASTSYYWPEMEAQFARVAEEIHRERKDSGPAVQYVAEYLYRGCNRPDRAIEVLADAHARKFLDSGVQVQLVRYLHERNRHEESIALLVPLVARSPDNLEFRTLLFTAYNRTDRRKELEEAFAATETYFRHKDRWGEGPMAALANSAVECKLYPRAVAIYGELIPLHQRSRPGRGVGDGVLSRYYQSLAQAHAALGQPMEAIDAAGGAIVSWGGDMRGRAEALATLKSVVAAAANLDGVVQKLDAQTAESGLINPVVRKAVGQIYHDRGKYLQAVAQLHVALGAQPNDVETLKTLTDCYDKMKEPDGAAQQVLRALELNRRDIKSYEDLGNRFAALGRGADAERAFTSIVEVLPNESEGHQLLAEIRQRQDRWADAIKHWEQVAKIRSLEPTGLIGLAAAQLHERQYEKAAETLGKLKARPWPPHFADAPHRTAELERQLRETKK
jgi:predicted Zn-dependent protease